VTLPEVKGNIFVLTSVVDYFMGYCQFVSNEQFIRYLNEYLQLLSLVGKKSAKIKLIFLARPLNYSLLSL
jgi:hypothetical protein